MNVQAAGAKRAGPSKMFIVDGSGGAALTFGATGQSGSRHATCATCRQTRPCSGQLLFMPTKGTIWNHCRQGTQCRGSSTSTASHPSHLSVPSAPPRTAGCSMLGVGGPPLTNRTAPLHNVVVPNGRLHRGRRTQAAFASIREEHRPRRARRRRLHAPCPLNPFGT